MLNLGVIGYGYWGPNVTRNFSRTKDCSLIAVCDKNPAALKKAQQSYPGLKVTTDFNDIVSSSHIDAVAIITPVLTHHELAKKSLENGKHIFVEKPFTATIAQAEELIELADRHNRTIMVDHTFLFTGAVKKIKELVDDGSLGELFYYDSIRVNLGLFQHDVNVIWDLAPHDLSIMDYVIREKPSAIMACGRSHLNSYEDVAYITVCFNNNLIAHLNVNWLSPVKVRTTLIGGDKRMLVWNDLEADEKIKVYDRGVNIKTREGIYDLLVSYRSGDMWSPRIAQSEALQLETAYFVDCILNRRTPFNDGHAGLRVVKILQASNRSLEKDGQMIRLD